MIIQGNIAVSTATFTTEATGANVDPGTVTFTYVVGLTETVLTYSGASVPAAGAVARTAEGVYVVWVDLTHINTLMRWRWDSTGDGQASVTGAISVTPNTI